MPPPRRLLLAFCVAGTPANVTCTQGVHKYFPESVGKGYYEVIGTLQQGGTIQEMNAVYMGDNFGARRALVSMP